MRRNRGLRSLKGYREGGGPPPPDTPATGASRALYGHEDISKRRQRNWEEQNRRRLESGPFAGRGLPLMVTQWARDIIGAQVRDRLGLETLGNWIGSPDITAGDLTPSEYEAMRETALRTMAKSGWEDRQIAPNRWELKYPDYGFSVTDPEHLTNKAFEAIMGGYDIDYDYEGWDKYGPGYRGNKEAIDKLVEGSAGYSTVSNIDAKLATQAAAGKGPAVTSSDLYKTLRGAAGLIPRATDPAAVLQQTLGRAAIVRDPDTGNYYIEDRYNWNNRLGRPFDLFSREDWGSLRDRLAEGEDIYDKARELSKHFGSRSGEGQEAEGSFVRINLGQLDDYYLDEAGRLAGGDARRYGAPTLASYLEDREEPTRFVSEEEEDGFQLSDIGEFVRRQGSRVMDFFDRPEEEEQPTRFVSEEEQELSIPSAPAAIEIQDITQTPAERARRQHQRLMSGVRVPGTRR